MPTLNEFATQGPLADSLAAGIADISQQQSVTFATYQKVILPLDGFVFWLRIGQFDQMGALHWMDEREQGEDETLTRNTVVFTTTAEIVALNQTNTQTLVVGEIEGRQFSFGRTGWYFPQAGVWHYQGESMHPAAATQIVDDPSQIDPTKVIVSGSLPAWLQLPIYLPVWITWPGNRNPQIPLYPSYLVPDNIEPPWGAVHIEPHETRALHVPLIGPPPLVPGGYSHYQMTTERVRVTLYGCNNEKAADFLDLVNQYSLDTDAFGIMNMPTIMDGKRPWREGMVLVQQKQIDFEISYLQTRINTIARQLILSAQALIATPDLRQTNTFAGTGSFHATPA